MLIRTVVFKNSADLGWEEDIAPGPLPQCVTRSFPTSRTYCTCGHTGSSHRTQRLTKGSGMDRTGALPTSYSAKRPLIFRGDCQAVVRVRGGREGVYRDYEECECTWFLEDLERVRLDAKQAKKDKKPVGRPRKDGSPAGSPREKKRPKYYDKIVW